MRSRPLALIVVVAAALAAASATSCKSAEEPASLPYFDRTIQPILTQSCSRQTTGCHQADPKGNAVGNLDTSSFDMLDRRHDLLVTYGPYQAPGLLTKVSGPQTVPVSTLDGTTVSITTDIRHAAASGIDVTSDGYATLRRWMDGGATRNNVGPSAPRLSPVGPCKKTIPEQPGFDPKADPGPTYAQFVDKVQPVLAKNCSAASCHGNDVAQFSLTCGENDDQKKWNAWIASQFIAKVPEASEIARRPLDPSRGGVYHEGGVVFDGPDDDGYKAIVDWAKATGAPKTDGLDDGFKYFANRVQPTMVRKGCMFLGCHSPSMFHDLRLSGGSGGQFSLAATRRNYNASKLMLSLESPDASVSRLINKNLFPYDRDIDDTAIGTRHRGGALLDDIPAGKTCADFDADKDDLNAIPGQCIFNRWHELERAAALKAGPAGGGVDTEPLRGIVYISRAPNTDPPQAFDTYRAGSSLHLAAATLAMDGSIAVAGDTDLTGGCGLSEGTADIRGPAVSWDGTKIAFAARTSAATPLAIYVMNADGSSCVKHDKIGAHDPQKNGILVHDFDPAWSPDGRIVFASTRGAIGQSDLDYDGPTRTPSTMLPNSNIYALDADGSIRQLSFLLNAELAPSFMLDGRLLYTTEKRAPGFYQLAGRRQNLDGGDYHPFYGQRKSLGFEQTTEVAELADRNFVAIFSDKGALASGGTVGVINRSLGPDQATRDPADRFYLKSLHLPDVAANGKKGSAGAYRSPAAIPTHGFIASYAAGDPYAFDGGYDLVQVDERTGARKVLVTRASGQSIVEAAAVYARANQGVFKSRIDEVNGAVQLVPGDKTAEVSVLDLPMLASLLFTNTREGRNVDDINTGLGVLESLPPPSGALGSFDGLDAQFVSTDDYGKLWVKRRRLGVGSTYDDHSIGFRIPGGMPFVLELYTDINGKPLQTQKEEMQYVPGERARSNFRRDLFGAQCGGCHGSISGREVDVHLVPDVLTTASRVRVLDPGGRLNDWVLPPSGRGGAFGGN
ncbi:MAG: TolB family protein [Polyangiales bacterium]